MNEMIVVPTVPYAHAQMIRDIAALRVRYPGLVGLYNAGYSSYGRQIPVLTVGNGRIKVFFLRGASRARVYHQRLSDVYGGGVCGPCAAWRTLWRL